MSSRRHASLKPHLNQVRGWVEMGATDLWIAHQLGSTPASIAAFRQKHGLLRTGAERPSPGPGGAASTSRRAAPAPADAAPPSDAPKPRRRRGVKAERTAEPEAVAAAAPDASAEAPPAEAVEDVAERAPDVVGVDGDGERPKRRRGRRGGRGRGKGAADAPLELEGVFDHGDEGYGLWLDGAVRDAAVYRNHWRGQREVVVRVTADEIVIRRAGAANDTDTDD